MMMSAVLGVYGFIAVGWLAKEFFHEEIDERGLTVLSVYFLQIFLTLWGLLQRPIDITLLHVPMIYLFITLSVLALGALLSHRLFHDEHERSIATIAIIIGNTGNLGIPIGMSLFGEQAIAYLTVINLTNVFIVYTFGVYYYARGHYGASQAIRKILHLPILWAALIAIGINLAGYRPSGAVEQTLMMGAYASMTLQLVIFGIYLHEVKIHHLSWRLGAWITGVKWLLIPLITYAVLSQTSLPLWLQLTIALELMVPLAVSNVNLAALYHCSPNTVAAQVLISSLLFLIGVMLVRLYF